MLGAESLSISALAVLEMKIVLWARLGSAAVDLFEELLKVMETLRGPKGCPWDKKQDHQSLIPCLLEESYELIDAIDQAESNWRTERD